MEPTQWMGHGFGFMWLFPLLFFVILIFFMRGMFGRGCGSRDGDATHQESAREILEKRLAKGEITKEEFEEIKKTLRNETS